ncbi:isoprenylcysteine carboxylmethyltransferase family protein [uncultured Roseobacter sp.]|uniref:methyltransferase family protein n=1 Tax=uncultured Roseobacter sp. TaxID=114847 RepID=UPI002622542E|nr:isoprenylcysteine carboxylmethyltransferase family protein [uncultured Roseobacter sp.]
MTLLRGVFDPEPGPGRIALALAFGLTVHLVFAAGVLAMVLAMYFGMSESLGTVPWPSAAGVNALLILQFPIAHSFFLTGPGMKILAYLVRGPHGGTLGTTTYAIIASLQLFILFAFWTPSGIIWWQAEGWALYVITTLYAMSWLLLLKASWDAGAEVQAGALGWMSLMKNAKPRFPDMPTTGLFRIIRQPIYVAFAFTLWTVPVWTPDQLALAMVFTAYCLLAPKLKERRFEKRYGDRFRDYRKDVPYVLPDLKRITTNVEHSPK